MTWRSYLLRLGYIAPLAFVFWTCGYLAARPWSRHTELRECEERVDQWASMHTDCSARLREARSAQIAEYEKRVSELIQRIDHIGQQCRSGADTEALPDVQD